MRSTRHFFAAALAVALISTAVPAQSQAPGPVRLELGEDGQFVRFISWHQFWARAIQQNPGSQVRGEPATPAADSPDDWTWDLGIRRSRFLVWAEYDIVQMIFHFGIDNQTFNQFKPQLFVHDAWGQLTIAPEFKVGAGMHYINGISRMTNHSTLSFLTVDAPILNWPTIEIHDQFGRWPGAFVRGQIADVFDYRLSISRTMNRGFSFATDDNGAAVDGTYFNSNTNYPALQGYFFVMLDEPESNTLPFMNGTYLGGKSVFNIGAGFLYLPDGMVEVADGTPEEADIFCAGVDVFLDRPIGDGALTSYLVYYYYDMGQDFVRNVGIMNISTGGGNAYPTIGTGSHIYLETGYLLPTEAQLQPYFSIQASFMDGLEDAMILPEVGMNYYLVGQNTKLTLNYRSRPIFDAEGTEEHRASDLILQLHVRI